MEISKETRASIKPACIGLAVGAAITMIVGFNWGGWHAGGTVKTMVAMATDAGRVTAMADICVVSYKAQPEAAANLAALKKLTSSYDRSDSVKKSGAANTPGTKESEYNVAKSCAEKLFAT